MAKTSDVFETLKGKFQLLDSLHSPVRAVELQMQIHKGSTALQDYGTSEILFEKYYINYSC